MTGDVSTDGSGGSLATALQFIEQDEIREPQTGRLLLYGLNAPGARRTILPGNHDRYGRLRLPFQSAGSKLEDVFAIAQRYPYTRVLANPNSVAVILYVFDSTQRLRLHERLLSNRLNRIARGELSQAECLWIRRENARLAAAHRDNPTEVDPSTAVRIAVLHHHPVLPEDGSLANKLTSMDNNQAFVDACIQEGIQVVLFGHQHHQYARTVTPPDGMQTPFGPATPLRLLCCPTTCEYSALLPGFYVHEVRPHQLTTRVYAWATAGFQEGPSLKIDLG